MTAVEWLEKEIWKRGPIGEDTPIWLKELYEEAKEMENRLQEEEYERGYDRGHSDGYGEGYHEGLYDSENK